MAHSLHYNLMHRIIRIISSTFMQAKQTALPGLDQKGSHYPSIDEMWEIELKGKTPSGTAKVVSPIGSEDSWYHNANEYWMNTEATYEGVLGGYANLSRLDIHHSLQFLMAYFKQHPEHSRDRVIDCGAGIGRIAKQLLCQIYKTVDVVDQCQKYIEKAENQILKDKNIGHFYVGGLQKFEFSQRYDCVWIQWVISHLTDEDMVKFLQKAKASLSPHGFIILKENHYRNGFLVDKEDYSVSRSVELFRDLLSRAQLKIVREEAQSNWPAELLEVRIYLLQ